MTRIIHTNLPATAINGEIISSIIGQMSDGIWENSRRMESVWRGLSSGSDGTNITIVVDYPSSLMGMPDFAVQEYIANKIKQAIKIEIADMQDRDMTWDRACKAHTVYLSYQQPVQVRDVYQAYDILKGRNIKTKVPTTVLAQDLVVGDVVEGKGTITDITPAPVNNQMYYAIGWSDRTVSLYKADEAVRKK